MVERFRELSSAGTVTTVVAGGVRAEVQNPRTPASVQDAILPQIFNLRPGLNQTQQEKRRRVEAIMRGNALPGAHAADASHLSEAVETGCGYFITHDERILKKRDELAPIVGPELTIVTLEEFFEIFDDYVKRRS